MATNITVLIIDDDTKIINYISLALRAKDYCVLSAVTGREGILSFCVNLPDIILLDLGMSDMDGINIIEEIRKVSAVPILVISARSSENDKICALDAGANDYVTKPFAMGELLARVRVMERYICREALTDPDDVYHFGDLSVDAGCRRVFSSGEEIHLTPLEYKLLHLLVINSGKVVTQGTITKEVWGYSETGDAKSIRVCISSLRRKLEVSGSPQLIFTHVGVGYRFADRTE